MVSISSSASSRRASSSGAALITLGKFADQLARQRREIVDEIERVLDLVRDAGGELAERGELFRLDEAVLRFAQVVERGGELLGARLDLVEQARVLDRDNGLVGEGLDDFDLALVKGRRLRPRQHDGAHPRGRRAAAARRAASACGSRPAASARDRIPGPSRRRECARPRRQKDAPAGRPSTRLLRVAPADTATRSLVRPVVRAVGGTRRPLAEHDRRSPRRTSLPRRSTSVSKTVCRSNAERLMTFSTSAVAVCCCSAS